MKLGHFLFLLAFLGGAVANEGVALRALLKKASAKSSAKSTSTGGKRVSTTASASSTGGTAEAVAEATAEAFVHVENKVVQYFKSVADKVPQKRRRQSKKKYCKEALSVIEEDLKAVGGVSATAYTEALAKVKVTGEGEACASSKATARSQASGFAQIMVDAIAKASIGKTKSEAKAVVDVAVDVFAVAFSESFAAACLQGEGAALATQTALSEAIIRPIASVTVQAVAGVDCSTMEGFSLTEMDAKALFEEEVVTETESHSEIEGEGTVESEGKAEAETGEIGRCSFPMSVCCRKKGVKTCDCAISRRGKKRCDAKLMEGGRVPYWYDENLGACQCFHMAYTDVAAAS